MSALTVSKLCKAFGGLRVTTDVNLNVEPGERRLIIGPNGAGKTTLFNLITGDLSPDDGSVKLFGQELLRIPTQQRVHLGLARTYQILTLFPKETLCHNVVLALLGLDRMRWNIWTLLSGKSHLYDTAREALALVGLVCGAANLTWRIDQLMPKLRASLGVAVGAFLLHPHRRRQHQVG